MDKIANGFAFVVCLGLAVLLISWAWENSSLAGFVAATVCLTVALGNAAAFTR